MTTTILILVAFGLYVLFCYYKGRDGEAENDNDEREQETEGKELLRIPTRMLVMRTLRTMGCEPVVDDRNGFICFVYQGENFRIEADNDCLNINVYDLWWHSLSMDADIEEFAWLQKAVNLVNGSANCTVLYTPDQEAKMIGVHSKKNILFISQIPDLEQYLMAALNDFFKVQREVLTEIEKQRAKAIAGHGG